MALPAFENMTEEERLAQEQAQQQQTLLGQPDAGVPTPTEGATVSGQVESPPVVPDTTRTFATEAATPQQFITPEATVRGQLESLLQTDSPLFKLAESRAEEQAQQRGLLSSSMAIGAGQRAIYDKALDIATPDAAQAGRSLLSSQEAGQRITQTEREGDITSGLTQQKGEIESAITGQKIEGQKEVAELEIEGQKAVTAMGIEGQKDMQTVELAHDTQIKEFLAGEDWNKLMAQLESEEGLAADELAYKYTNLQETVNIEAAKMDSAEKTAFLEASYKMYGTLNQSIAEISKIPTEQLSTARKQGFIDQLIDDTQGQMAMMASIYGGDIVWDVGGGGAGDGGGGGDGAYGDITPEVNLNPSGRTGFLGNVLNTASGLSNLSNRLGDATT